MAAENAQAAYCVDVAEQYYLMKQNVQDVYALCMKESDAHESGCSGCEPTVRAKLFAVNTSAPAWR